MSEPAGWDRIAAQARELAAQELRAEVLPHLDALWGYAEELRKRADNVQGQVVEIKRKLGLA